MPYGGVLKDERPTSNIERPITPRREKNKHPIPNIQRLFLFLHLSPFNVRCWTFDVRCSSFSVPPRQKQLSAYALNPLILHQAPYRTEQRRRYPLPFNPRKSRCFAQRLSDTCPGGQAQFTVVRCRVGLRHLRC
jgi:hypothetical protein